MIMLWFVIVPFLSYFLGYLPGFIFGAPLPRGVALEWAFWGRHREYMVDARGESNVTGFKAFRGRLLSYEIDLDPYAPRDAVQALVSKYNCSKSIERRHLAAKFGHFGFFRRNSDTEQLWEEVANWIKTSIYRPAL